MGYALPTSRKYLAWYMQQQRKKRAASNAEIVIASFFTDLASVQVKINDTGGNVEEWRSINNDSVFASTTVGSPVFSVDEVVFDRATPSQMVVREGMTATLTATVFLPDSAQEPNPSGGFTNTGLDKLANGNWLVGNDGRSTESTTPNNSSLVILSADKSTIVSEIDVSGVTLANGGSVQGVTVAPDGSYWFCAPSESKVFHVSNVGVKLGEIATLGAANGIAYDEDNAAVWVQNQGESTANLRRVSDGVSIKQIDVTSAGDQLSYDEVTKTLAVTFGDNAQPGSVIFYNTDIDQIIGKIPVLSEAEAIEGIYIDYTVGNGIFELCHDGGFHTNATPARSIIYTYSIDQPLVLTNSPFLGVHADITLNGSAPSNRETIMAMHDPDGSSGGGWALYVMNSNRIRLQVRSKTTGDIWFSEYAITRSVNFTFSAYVDINTDTFYAEIDGIEVAPASTLNSVSVLDDEFNAGYHTIGRKSVGTVYPASFNARRLALSENMEEFNRISSEL